MAWCVKLRLFILYIVAASLLAAAASADTDPVTDFIVRADSLSQAGGDTVLMPYVVERGILVGAVVGQLLDVAFEIGEGGDRAAEEENVAFAERVARLYAENGGTRVPIEEVETYRGWSADQRAVRARAKALESEAFEARGQGEYDRAVGLFLDVIDLAESIGDRRTIAVTWGSLGVAHWYRGDNDAVVESYTKALGARRAIEDRILEGKTLNGLGSIHFRKGEYGEAVRYYGEAAALRRRTGDFGGLGISLTYQSNTYYQQSRLFDARACLDEAYRVLEKFGSPEQMIEVLNSMASIDSDMGQIDRANETYLRAIEIAATVDSPQDEAACRLNLAGNLSRQGRYREAKEQFDAVPALLARQPEPMKEVLFRNYRGGMLVAIGELDQARDDFLAALETARELEDPLYEITTRNELGSLYIELGAPDRALEIARESQELSEQAGYPREYVSACILAANAAQAMGDFAAAISYRRLALEQNTADGDNESALEDELGIALCRAAWGHLDQARETFYSLMPEVAETGRRDLLELIHEGIGHTFERIDPDSAAYHYDRALSLIEESRANVGGAETRTGFLGGERRMVYEEVARYYASLSTGENKDPWTARSFHTVERAKSRGLLDLIERNVLSRTAPEEEAVLDSLYALDPEAPGADELQRRLEARYIELRETRVRESMGSFATRSSVAELAAVQKKLPKRTVLLEYALGDTVSLLWVIDRKNASVFEIPNRAALEPEVQRFRDAVRRPGSGDAALRETSRSLYSLLVGPAEPFVDGAETLVIVPDGFLFELPFEALLCKDPDPDAGWSELPFVTRSFKTVYAPSASIFLKLAQTKSRRKHDSDLLAFGGPDYSLFDSEPGASLEPLPSSALEVERIGETFDEDRRSILRGAEATEAHFKKSVRAGSARITHLATHGLIDPVEPITSNVVLAPDPEGGEDGYLYTLEILSLPVESGVVVLSACESATGRVGRGEGVVGLSRAFMGAGARGVVASLWPVSDESTAELMAAFYGTMAGKKRPAGEALQSARLELIGGGTYAHPFYWSPFVVIGTTKIPW
jgi:CHAT domain-containing protein/Tfp pilus assembly protein PilF